jgi:hypothetical protein
VFLAEDSDLLSLTLKNALIRSGSGTDQAEAICFRSSTASPTSGHRLVARNANFYSEQTTLQLQGYTWFYNTKVSGNVDAIWGNNRVSLFEASTLEMLGDSAYPPPPAATPTAPAAPWCRPVPTRATRASCLQAAASRMPTDRGVCMWPPAATPPASWPGRWPAPGRITSCSSTAGWIPTSPPSAGARLFHSTRQPPRHPVDGGSTTAWT